jgi:hypothetical protein
LVHGKPAILSVGLAVFRANVAAKVRAINLNLARERYAVIAARHRLAELMRQDEGRLVLAVQIARELKRGDTLGGIDEDADRREQVYEVHLARREDGARRGGEALAAGPALPLAAGGDEVGLGGAAFRAEGFPAVLRKVDRRERLERLIVGHPIHVLELEGPGGGGKEEMLGHLAYPSP